VSIGIGNEDVLPSVQVEVIKNKPKGQRDDMSIVVLELDGMNPLEPRPSNRSLDWLRKFKTSKSK
jgi:hypothetical protein